MPELPEVETIARQLHPVFIGQVLTGLWCNWPRMLSLARPTTATTRRLAVSDCRKAIEHHLRGARVTDITRRAKLLVWHFGASGSLLIHLRMSGRPVTAPADTVAARHVHFILRFASGVEMHLDDARKFARATWTDDVAAATADLGIEPLEPEFTPDVLRTVLRSRSRLLKPALLDQTLIAGLGNIYTDEALHRSRLHPLRKSDSLRPQEIERLHHAIVESLQSGILHKGASIDWVYPGGEMQDRFLAYGRTGEPCMQCGTPIRRLVVGQRGTHVCPICQPAPRRRRR